MKTPLLFSLCVLAASHSALAMPMNESPMLQLLDEKISFDCKVHLVEKDLNSSSALAVKDVETRVFASLSSEKPFEVKWNGGQLQLTAKFGAILDDYVGWTVKRDGKEDLTGKIDGDTLIYLDAEVGDYPFALVRCDQRI